MPRCCKVLPHRYLIFTMSRYKYFVLLLMLVLIIYSITMDISYPFIHRNQLKDIESVLLQEDRISPPQNKSKKYTVYNLTKDYSADFECVKTKTSPQAVVCLYPPFTDMYISHDLRETGQWEPQILPDFLEMMNKDSSLGLIDIGANIGYYTMLAVALGRKSLALEPNLNSIYRIHKAAVMTNSTSNIVVLHNAVSDLRTTGTIRNSGDNQGDVRVKPTAVPCIGSCPKTVDIILLNDIIDILPFKRAVLKLDIQGIEHKAMHYANKLLKHIHIPLIIMEWGLMPNYYLPGNQTSSDKLLVERMINLLFDNNFRPYKLSKDGGNPLDPALWHQWPYDVLWRKLASEGELEEAMRNHFMNWP